MLGLHIQYKYYRRIGHVHFKMYLTSSTTQVWPDIRRRIVLWWRHQMETFSASLPFVRGIHRLTVSSPHKGQWRGALMFSLVCAWVNALVNNREARDLRRHRAHYDVVVMYYWYIQREISSFMPMYPSAPDIKVQKCFYTTFTLKSNGYQYDSEVSNVYATN